MKKLVMICALAGSLMACNNAGESTAEKKDSLDSIAGERKDVIDSAAEARKDRIDSVTERKKDSLDRIDSINRRDTVRK